MKMQMPMGKQEIKAPSYKDHNIITFGTSVIMIVFVILGGWMAYAPLASTSVAAGTVSADLEKKTIQHLEGGKISKIYVKNGDTVKKGDVLIKLRDVQIDAQQKIYAAQLQDGLALFARLRSQIEKKASIEFPKTVTDTNAMRDQINIFENTNITLRNEKRITKNKILQTNKQIEGSSSILKSKQQRVASIKEEIQEWKDLYKEKLVDKQRIRELERERDRIDGEIASAISEIAKLKETINEIEEEQSLRETNLNKETLQDYVKVKASIYDLQSKMIANDDTLKRTSIIAPIDGTVVGLTMHTVGGIINRGEAILEIVPKNTKLLIIAKVQTKDIDKVKVGLLANVTFPAFNLKQIKVIQGRVLYVSADVYEDKQQHMQYYEAKIEVTKEGMETLKKNNFVLVPGMKAQAMIQIGERTALSYLLKPFMNMLLKAFNEE